MSRKRHRLVPDTFGLKRRREPRQAEADPLRGESGGRGSPGPRPKAPAGSGLARRVAQDASAAPPAPLLVSVTGSPHLGSARAAVAELVQLFPRGLFEDALPPIALRSQVYSLVPDRTAADRQLVRGVGATDGSRFPASTPSLRHPGGRPAALPFSRRQVSPGRARRGLGKCRRPC